MGLIKDNHCLFREFFGDHFSNFRIQKVIIAVDHNVGMIDLPKKGSKSHGNLVLFYSMQNTWSHLYNASSFSFAIQFQKLTACLAIKYGQNPFFLPYSCNSSYRNITISMSYSYFIQVLL